MEPPPDVSKISELWTLLGSLAVGLVSLGVFKAKVATKADLETSESNQETLLRKSLYRDDGTSVYTPRAECERTQSGCSNRICAKLDELKIDGQRRHEEHMRLHEGLPEFVGTVKQFMHQHHRRTD